MDIKQLTKISLMVALTVALSLMVVIPVPATKGLVTLCDVGIYVGAFLFGPIGGFFVGALSGGLIDLLSGYPQWIIFSFIIHGVQGLIAGYLMQRMGKRIFSLIVASIWMIIGYMIATGLLYGWPAGMASIIGNIMQTAFGTIVAMALIQLVEKSKLIHGLEH